MAKFLASNNHVDCDKFYFDRATKLIFTVSCCLMLFTANTSFTQEAQSNEAKAACVAFQANLDSLTRFKCQYRLTKANAKSIADAIAGRYENIRSCDYILVVDGEQTRFQTVTQIDLSTPNNSFNTKSGNKSGDIKGPSFDFVPINVLNRGEEGFIYTQEWQVAVLSKKGETPRQHIQTPLSIVGHQDLMSPTRLLGLTGKSQVACKSKGISNTINQPVLSVELNSAEWGRAEWSFGLNQSFLPLSIITNYISPNGLSYPTDETHVKEFRKLEKQGWFPIHIIHFGHPVKQGGFVSVLDIRVTELTSLVKQDDLTLEIPENVKISWRMEDKHGKAAFRTQQKEKISPNDIPRLQEMLENKSKNPLMDTVVHPPSNRSTYWLIAGGVIVMLIAVDVIRRRRSRG